MSSTRSSLVRRVSKRDANRDVHICNRLVSNLIATDTQLPEEPNGQAERKDRTSDWRQQRYWVGDCEAFRRRRSLSLHYRQARSGAGGSGQRDRCKRHRRAGSRGEFQRPRSSLRPDQVGERKTRYRLCERWCREVCTAWIDQRRDVRRAVRQQRKRCLVHRTEGASGAFRGL